MKENVLDVMKMNYVTNTIIFLCVITSEMKEICCYQNATLSVITCLSF